MTRRVCEYATLMDPFDGPCVSQSSDTCSGSVFVAVAPTASVTMTWTLYVPSSAGFPQISASPAVIQLLVTPSPKRSDMPDGSPVAAHVNGPVPPVT